MILRYEHGKLVERRTYREALCLEADVSPVLSIVGAGGKTTTALHLAQEFVSTKTAVAVTTSTHMQIEAKPWFLLEESMEKLLETLEREKQVWFGIPEPLKEPGGVRKMRMVSDPFFRKVCALQIPVIVEADGARRMPCKVPGEHEPVLYPETTEVLAVYGLDAIGKSIQDSCFRPEKVAEVLKKQQTDCLDAKDIAMLATDKQGGRKGVSENQNYWIILNKADDEERIEVAKCICEKISEQERWGILVTSHVSEGVQT